jgi:biopolymer transport protein ExbD
VAVFAVALLLGGCDDTRPNPYPFIDIAVHADGTFALDGRRYDQRGIEQEILRLSDSLRRDLARLNRAYVRIAPEHGVDYGRVQRLVARLTESGFHHIQTTVR